MRFKKQFEFHKIPEWDDQYTNYELFLEKIENIVNKITAQKMKVEAGALN